MSHSSMCIPIRRATRYVPPRIQAAPSAGWTHTCLSIRASSSALRLLVPSLNPCRLRGVSWDVLVLDARLKPSCHQRSCATPFATRTILRTAWKATWESSAQAWMQRSPPERPVSNSSPGMAGMSASWFGLCPARPNRSTPSRSNRVGPKPMVSVSLEGGWLSASPVSSGGREGCRGPSPTGFPSHIRAAASDQARSSCWSWVRSSVVTSKAAKCMWFCVGVAMPAW